MQKPTIKKLNTSYESDPNISEPSIKINGNKVRLSFPLNYFTSNYKEGQIGVIEFNNVKALRSGSPNDEGYSLDDNPLWSSKIFGHIDWDSFYEVTGAPKEYLDSFYKTDDQDYSNLKHYVFFMKEGTFECLAESYKEII